MKINFHGAAQTVTGSQHLIQVNGHSLLLDCGLYQGARQEAFERNRRFAYDPRKVDAVILSHAHIDHSGNLPNLVKQGYSGPIFATRVTAHLSEVMLLDSGHIHEADAQYLNKERARRGEPAIEPLYTQADAAQVGPLFQGAEYEQAFEAIPGVQARLVEAGHILGSAAVVLDIEEKGRKSRLWFSGDIGRRNIPLVRDPIIPEKADTLIMESTCGDTVHPSPEQAFDHLREMVARTVRRGGKVIIPAFAVGRTQELVYNLHQMIDRREIPLVPIYVDSPLAVNISDIFREHPDYFDQETQDFLAQDSRHSALGFEMVTYVRSVEQSKALNGMREPMVIISASGMAETGRILHHLKNNIEDRRNTILIVSWQAPWTLGRRLADGEKQVRIFGEVYERQAEVARVEGFSAHAGQPFLMEYALAVKQQLRGVYLVHGEREPAQALREKLGQAGLGRVYFPELHSAVEV
ncbi:MAG TPA: MBL fold metallo-hydrolase [Anaerolineales bacterium]|nr:MBL fold metallo-hydrolase [Anaerolineales bacterium]